MPRCNECQMRFATVIEVKDHQRKHHKRINVRRRRQFFREGHMNRSRPDRKAHPRIAPFRKTHRRKKGADVNYGYDPTPYDAELARAIKGVVAQWPADTRGMRPYVELDALYPGVRIRRMTHYTEEQLTFFTKQLDDTYKKVMDGKKIVECGQIVATDGVDALIREQRLELHTLMNLLRKHRGGDWGIVDDEDKRANDAALKNGTRVLSAWKLTLDACPDEDCPDKDSHSKKEVTIWIITEGDRSVTTFLLPEEY